MENWIQFLSLNVAIFGVFIIPAATFFYRKLKENDIQFQHILKVIADLQSASTAADLELSKNWLYFYYNEILKFTERLHLKPEVIPTQEHYRSVFEHYDRYRELGGNGFISILMEQIRVSYQKHYGKEYK